MDEPAVRLAGLRKNYGSNVVLNELDLEVAPGTVFGYLGPNGAGKSTTVRILCGMDDDYHGSAQVGGIEAADDPLEVKRRIGYVPESAELYDVLTGFEHLQLVGQLHGLDPDTITRRGKAMADAFGLGPRLNTPIGSYSKGMRQKVLFCAALLHDPPVLFLDEPLSGLDVASSILVKELIRGLAERGRTVFYCSHVMDVVERVCDRIVILHEGVIVADGTFEELSSQSQSEHLEGIFADLTGAGDSAAAVADILSELA
ncbi:MAG: ABC transporter ATP-binding protein [Planctomycetota bacterium]|nr:ABC transporter ATP-binding protein [Planctomycetota bacterium]